MSRDCVGDCYVVFCDPVFAELVQDARATRLSMQPVGKVTLEKAVAAKGAVLLHVAIMVALDPHLASKGQPFPQD